MANRDDAKRLAELAVYLHGTANEIMAIADRIPRKPAVRKTKPRSDYMTITIGKQARYLARIHPDWSNQKIGDALHVNTARVSEATTPGTKKWSAPPGWKP